MNLLILALPAIGGLAIALAFPGTNWWPLAFVACVPFIMSLHGSSPRRAAWLGLLFGLIFYGVLIHWIRLFGNLPWVLLVWVEACTTALFAVIASFILRNRLPIIRVIGVASAWVLVEWVRSLGSAGFTWGSLAYSQAYNLPVARIAGIAGPWGVSFLVMLINVGIAEAIRTKRTLPKVKILALPVTLLLLASVWGVSRPGARPHNPLKVAVIQASIPQMLNPPFGYSARQWAQYVNLTQEAVELKPDIIVWPESAVPDDLDRSPWLRRQMHLIARKSSADVITGGVRFTQRRNQPREQNGAYVITPDKGLQDRYFKVRLVPFGEYVPARKWLKIAERYGVREIDYMPGSGWQPVQTTYGKIGTVICFESTFPQISQALVRRGAAVLFVLTNDGWFERTAAAEQHLQMSILRAVENGRYVVRSTTTGISAVIAPDGTITSSLGLWEKEIMTGEVEPLATSTPYTRLGDWFAYLSATLTLATLFSGLKFRGK